MPAGRRAPAFQFYPKEFLSSSKVIAMTATERGVYITLLSMQWLDGSVPADMSALARLVGMRTSALTKLWKANLSRCFEEHDGRLVNARLEEARQSQTEFRQRQSNAAASRWHRHGRPAAQARDSQNDALQSASASATAKTRGSPLIAPRRLDAVFEGPRVYVPRRLHTDFLGLRGPDAEPALLTWYERISGEWTTGARKDDEPGADMFAFWRARYAERWPATPTAPPSAPSAAEREQRRNTAKYARPGP